ncbi:hypothetical protein JCM3774_004120 [Rhodotorula dairenensis]
MGPTRAQLDLLDLFPPASTSASAPVLVDAASIAFVGPLPAAAPLHFALNHLRREEEDRLSDETRDRQLDGLSERARGKLRAAEEGSQDELEDSTKSPTVDAPPLMPGCAQTPHRTRQRRVLVLTPDRDVLRDQLIEEGEGSLAGDKLDGPDQALLDRIDIRYLPTSAHLTYFLSTAYEPDDLAAAEAYANTGGARTQDPSLLRYRPSLVVLHAPSTYLREPALAEAGAAGLASLLAQLFATFSRGTLTVPILAIFDPSVTGTKLPLLPRHLQARQRDRARQTSEQEGIPALSILRHFCDWTGQVERVRHLFDDETETNSSDERFLLSCQPSAPLTAPCLKTGVGLEYRILDRNDPDRPTRLDVV